MRRINKTGATMSFLVSILVVLISLAILLGIYGKTADLANAKEAEDICRQHIELAAIGNVGGSQLYDDIRCPIIYVEEDHDDPEIIKETLAKSMASCWHKMGAGQYDIFATPYGETQYCVICGVTTFTGKEQQVDGFLSYLDTAYAPALYTLGQTQTYTTYLQGYQSSPDMHLLYDEETGDVIDTGVEYATIFTYAKYGAITKIWSTIGGTLIGGSVGMLPGTVPGVSITYGLTGGRVGYALGSDVGVLWDSGVLVYPYQDIDDLNCDMLPVKR